MSKKSSDKGGGMVFLEPSALIGRQRKGGSMRLAETEGGEGAQDLPDLINDGWLISPRERRGIEPLPHSYLAFRRGHLSPSLIAFGQRCACNDRDNTNHLFVEDDNTLGLLQDLVEIRVNQIGSSKPLTRIEKRRDHVALHWARSKKRDIDDEIFK